MASSFEKERNTLMAQFLKEAIGRAPEFWMPNPRIKVPGLKYNPGYSLKFTDLEFNGIGAATILNYNHIGKDTNGTDWISLFVNYNVARGNLICYEREDGSIANIRAKEASYFYFSLNGEMSARHDLGNFTPEGVDELRQRINYDPEYGAKMSRILVRKPGQETHFSVMAASAWYEFATNLLDELHRRHPKYMPSLMDFMAKYRAEKEES